MEKMDVIKKLKALSDRGINGEKENATKLLNKLMKKYGITEEELEKSEVKTIWITLKNHAEVKICSQILYAHFENVSLWQRNGHRTKYSKIINENGKVKSFENLGKKRLAYEIRKNKEGFYMIFNFESEASFISELERQYRIDDNVIKFIVVRRED